MVRCVLSQLKLSELYILSSEKRLGLRPRPFFKAKNVELLGLYPIHRRHVIVLLRVISATLRAILVVI